uniref:Uncharacterized protein n=1 Tax=Oryza meridionalis TaxID=40149 RepID=A0A0E0DEF6_9ORYZ
MKEPRPDGVGRRRSWRKSPFSLCLLRSLRRRHDESRSRSRLNRGGAAISIWQGRGSWWPFSAFRD